MFTPETFWAKQVLDYLVESVEIHQNIQHCVARTNHLRLTMRLAETIPIDLDHFGVIGRTSFTQVFLRFLRRDQLLGANLFNLTPFFFQQF